jgi:hypothetical protein
LRSLREKKIGDVGTGDEENEKSDGDEEPGYEGEGGDIARPDTI